MSTPLRSHALSPKAANALNYRVHRGRGGHDPKQTGAQSGHLPQRSRPRAGRPVHLQVPDHLSPHFPIWALGGNTPASLPCLAQEPSPDPPRHQTFHRQRPLLSPFLLLEGCPASRGEPRSFQVLPGLSVGPSAQVIEGMAPERGGHQGGSASVSGSGRGLVSHQCPFSLPTGPPSPRPSSPPACTGPSAKASLTWA